MARSRALRVSIFPQNWVLWGGHVGHMLLFCGFRELHYVLFLYMFFWRGCFFVPVILGRLKACKLCYAGAQFSGFASSLFWGHFGGPTWKLK